MPVPRIHCDQRLGPGAQFSLDADAAQHVAKSLRLKAGDALVVFDGRGGEYDAAIQRIDRDRVDVKVGAFRDAGREPALMLGLAQGLPEADKMDWIIQKATELGVAWIQPVTCERSVVRLTGDRAVRREAHWRRVAIAACEQCARADAALEARTRRHPDRRAPGGTYPARAGRGSRGRFLRARAGTPLPRRLRGRLARPARAAHRDRVSRGDRCDPRPVGGLQGLESRSLCRPSPQRSRPKPS
jgi:hypothetical protein